MSNAIRDTPSHNTYYDEHFEQIHSNEAEDMVWAEIRKAIIKSHHTYPKNLTILDFGCGIGWLSNKLTEFGKVTGIDFSEQSIVSAKKQFTGIDFKTMDITSKQLEQLGKESFDLIVSSEVMEHMTSHELFLNQISFLLKKNGILLLTTPNGKWHNAYFTNEMLSYKQPIENWITGNGLKTLLQLDYNSVSLKTFYANWIYSSRSTLLLKILANDYIRAGLIKMHLFDAYLKLLERFGLGLHLIATAKRS